MAKKIGKIVLRVILWILIILAALTLVASLLFLGNDWVVRVTPAGSRDITLSYEDEYLEPGAASAACGKLYLKDGLPLETEITGTVLSHRLGTYKVSYHAKFLWFEGDAERHISIVDTKAPEITLVKDPNHYTLPGRAYEEEGFSARDEYDGDLTSKVVAREEDGVVRYTVEDSSGNHTSVVRVIRYDDPIAPDLKLLGGDEVTIPAGTEFEDPGVYAFDNCDGDLSDKVISESDVNIYHAGTYTVSYSVSDEKGNTTQAVRTVIVEPIRQSGVIDPGGKIIYLTFDDGPSQYTNQLLDVLAKYNAKATFFVVNTGMGSTIGREIREGHSVGVHSATHNYNYIYSSEEAYFADLNRMRDIIYENTGTLTTLIRFPGGSSNTVSSFNPGIMSRLAQDVTDMGFQYFDWNVDSNDAGGANNSDTVYQNVINGASGRRVSVVLQHDTKGFSVAAVEKILIWGIENGYTFLPLTSSSPTAHHGIAN